MDKNNTHIVQWCSYALLLFALIWSLRYVFEGLGNVMDPLYWMHKYAHAEGGWMASGTIVIGHLLVSVFGAQLMPLRFVAWLCVVVAILLPYGMLLNSEQRKANIPWLAISLMLMNYGAFQEFSPGTLTVLCLSAIWCILIRFQRTKKVVWLVCVGLLTGMAIAIRFPNILVLLVVLCAIVLSRELSREMKLRVGGLYMLYALIGAGVLYGIAWAVMTPAYMDAAMGSHQISSMIEQLWTKGALLFGSIAIWVAVVLLGRELQRRLTQKWCVVMMCCIGLGIGLLLAHYVTFVPKASKWYNIDLTYMVSAFCLVIAFMSAKKELWWGMFVLVVATLGTDTAWLKLFPVVLCLLPIAAVHYAKKLQLYLLVISFVFAITVMVRFSINSIGNCNLRHVDTWASIAPYENIRIPVKDAEWLELVKSDYEQYANDSITILAVGQRMHMMREVTGCQAAVYNEFWSNIFDKVYMEKYQEYVRRERPIVFCTFAPNFKTKPSCVDTQSAFENMLRAEEYREIDRSEYKYMIYIPSND